METVKQKIIKALDSLEEWAVGEDRSGDPMLYLIMYAMMELIGALAEMEGLIVKEGEEEQ